MHVSFLGLGRLGLPVAAVLSQHHQVTGYDPDPTTPYRLKHGHPWEPALTSLLGNIELAPGPQAADVTVICVPTPHHPKLDGTWPDMGIREPFDLTYLEDALKSVRGGPAIVMSTVLPGDCRRLSGLVDELIYAPAFPAMGTTVEDFTDPEFVLIGGPRSDAAVDLFQPVYDPDLFCLTDWETAELAKVAYNTAIGSKIALANTVGWLGAETGADGHQVMAILSRATRRIVSPAYMRPGLGDGGACHPRDQIAMSWLAQQHGVFDLFGALIAQREAHSEWVATQAQQASDRSGMDVVILGGEYKADSTLTDGSPAMLLHRQTGWPIVDTIDHPAVVVIGVPHTRYSDLDLAECVVVDPWGFI